MKTARTIITAPIYAIGFAFGVLFVALDAGFQRGADWLESKLP